MDKFKMEIKFIIICIIFFIIGLGVANIYHLYNFEEVNEQRVEKELDGKHYRDEKGDWVCVNIYGMDFNRAIEVCKHEVGHEIFAETCENNLTKCQKMLK